MSPDSNLSVVQLHSHEYGGGAEAVARMNHSALKSLGHNSQLIVGQKKSSDLGIDQLAYQRGVPGSRRIARTIEQATGLQYIYSPSFRRVPDQFRINPDIVHIHAVHGASGWADLTGLRRLQRTYPTIFSLQDLWWLTGHCAYGMECNRWKTGCGECPDLSRYPAVSKDGTAWNWNRKRALFKNRIFHCIAPSEWVKKQALESPILQHCKIHVVPNPIDTKVFKPGNRERSRQLLGVPVNVPTVLVAANHLDSQFKGVEYAIEVLNRLTDTGTFVILVGKSSQEVLGKISNPGKSMGYIESSEQMAHCYKAADVFLIPSKVETFGLVSAEAVACGAAVVSFQAGGLEEVTKTGEGIVVKDYDVGELHAATRHLLISKEERLKRISLGQPRVSRLFSPEAHTAGCVEAYRKAIKSFRRRPDTRG